MFNFEGYIAVENDTDMDEPRLLQCCGIYQFDGRSFLAALELSPNPSTKVQMIEYLDDLEFYHPEGIEAAKARYLELVGEAASLSSEVPAGEPPSAEAAA